jgi:hypothetical protein
MGLEHEWRTAADDDEQRRALGPGGGRRCASEDGGTVLPGQGMSEDGDVVDEL